MGNVHNERGGPLRESYGGGRFGIAVEAAGRRLSLKTEEALAER